MVLSQRPLVRPDTRRLLGGLPDNGSALLAHGLRRGSTGPVRPCPWSRSTSTRRRTACPATRRSSRPRGSCIAVVATDAPLGAEQLERVARRAGLGLPRTGSVAHHGSGEMFIAFSTGRDADTVGDGELDPLLAATVDATEEAVLNALWSAERVVGRESRIAEALPHEEVVALLRAHRRLRGALRSVRDLHQVGAKTVARCPPVLFNRT